MPITESQRAERQSVLEFDAALHRYSLDGRPIPSVTQVIGAILPGWQADPWYMQRGTALHHGCRLMDEDRLDWSSVSPEIKGRLRAWEKFRADLPSTMLSRERQIAHATFRFAGTLDAVFATDVPVLCDIKSTIAPQVAVQLGAYKILYDQGAPRPINSGVAVELRDDGTYRCKWFDRKELELAGRVFLACLTIFGWKKENACQPS